MPIALCIRCGRWKQSPVQRCKCGFSPARGTLDEAKSFVLSDQFRGAPGELEELARRIRSGESIPYDEGELARAPLDHKLFQTVFGEVMTLLIALEFNHTLQYVVTRQQSIIQTKVVLLIALLALARKFIILDLQEVSASHLLGLAAVTLALGLTYWLVCERDAPMGASRDQRKS